MNKPPNKSTHGRSLLRDKDKKSLIQGGLVVFIIAITPFLYYLYESFPIDSQVWETSFFTLSTKYPSLYQYAWFLTGKIIPVILLLMWFFTCKHWWHWIILVPLAMYIFQLWGVINQSRNQDEVEIVYLIPLMMVIIPFVYLIRARLFNKIREDNLKTFEEELLQKRTFWQQIKDLFR
ncbi:hypothetical protein [Aequorivita echinoideorum]|uniref:Uncharacterized protein n=1 Tax=Aequorivita echinoideorum TaxID=1549647 RepID=A0ABS5S6B6_9FLAO|nr:hypothetical protein [Aequorivita echinoideorum]MBT0608751.1 hypothetical protein [Aequorivita echinoideorum]